MQSEIFQGSTIKKSIIIVDSAHQNTIFVYGFCPQRNTDCVGFVSVVLFPDVQHFRWCHLQLKQNENPSGMFYCNTKSLVVHNPKTKENQHKERGKQPKVVKQQEKKLHKHVSNVEE